MNGNRKFLERFPDNLKSKVVNSFLQVVRRGNEKPFDVLSSVVKELESSPYDQIAKEIYTEPKEAMDLARYAVWWESLSEAEKKKIKQDRAQSTEKQLKFLLGLGYTGETPKTMNEASQLIDKLVSKNGSRSTKRATNVN